MPQVYVVFTFQMLLHEVHMVLMTTHHPGGHGFYPYRFQNRKPGKHQRRFHRLLLLKHTCTHVRTHTQSTQQHLDVEFEVFIHGKDVVENVLSNARNNAHLVRVVELALKWTITELQLGVGGGSPSTKKKCLK